MLKTYIRKLFCLILLFIHTVICLAEGSKDLYPAGVLGNRAFLVSGSFSLSSVSFPFINYAEHYVYVNAGEILAVASSAQGLNQGHIRLTNPLGEVHTTEGRGDGSIRDQGLGTRAAELAGPRVGYTPYELMVDASTAGIWKVEFIPPTEIPFNNNLRSPQSILADENWEQSDGNNFIAAWDISVFSTTNNDWVEGRVYTNILNLQINAGYMSNSAGAYYGRNYVMTNDGYLYRVNGNGSNGIAFSYFVNNKGFLDVSYNPTYKSINSSRIGDFNIHDPRNEDLPGHITHKMMYNLPALDLPERASGAVPSGSTWLMKRNKATATVRDIRMVGAEGTVDYVSARGSKIFFETTLEANYKVTVSSLDPQKPFAPVGLIVAGKVGKNEVLWNGRDGNDNLLPEGERYLVGVKVELLEGEVHFPYIDMEINPNGIIIELLDDTRQGVVSDIVYWDDSFIRSGAAGESSSPTTNLTGLSSNVNGHRWGTYRDHTSNTGDNSNYGSFSYGNEKAMDTWAYALTVNESDSKEITVKIADLEVASVTTTQTDIELGENVVYEIKVINNGPSDITGAVFDFVLSSDFEIITVTHQSRCGQMRSEDIQDNAYQASIDLPNTCELIFTFTAVAQAPVADETYGTVSAFASILRPIDTTDPDATSILPLDAIARTALSECENNGQGGTCNNIKWNHQVNLLEPLRERGKLSLVKLATHVDDNEDQFKQVGEVISYFFNLKNTGFVAVDNLVLTDSLLSSHPLSLPQTRLEPGAEIQLVMNYVITQEDFDRGYIENVANIEGTNPRGFKVIDVSGTSEENDIPTMTLIEKKPLLQLKKTIVNSGTGTNGIFTIDDQIHYKFKVLHQGEIAIRDLQISDPLISNESILFPRQAIQNEVIQMDRFYRVTDADIDRGYVVNSARLYGIESKFGTQLQDISGLTFEDDLPTRTPTALRAQAKDDDVWLYQNNQATFYPILNDLKGTGDLRLQSIQIVRPPAHGNIQTQSDGTLVYNPETGYVGNDALRYRVMDANRLWSSEAEVRIEVRKTNPIAVVDVAEVDFNHSIQLNVMHNDYVEGATLDYNSLEIVFHPKNGTLTMLGNGLVKYTPSPNFTGVDEFIYRMKDSNGWFSNDAKVTVVTKGYFIPNTFTPNGDGINDTFQIIGTYAYDCVEVHIFNRTGQLLYSQQDYQNDWDGQGMADGTYLCLVSFYAEGKVVHTHRSWVALIRKVNF